MLFFLKPAGGIDKPTATYWGARLLTQEWVSDGNRPQNLFLAASDLTNSAGEQIVTAYALHRPDGRWSLLLINKDPKRAHDINVVFRNASGKVSGFSGAVDAFQFSREQYRLSSDRNHPRPIKSDPPIHFTLNQGSAISLRPYSMTVVRGRLEETTY